jgi:hypothetical protein
MSRHFGDGDQECDRGPRASSGAAVAIAHHSESGLMPRSQVLIILEEILGAGVS